MHSVGFFSSTLSLAACHGGSTSTTHNSSPSSLNYGMAPEMDGVVIGGGPLCKVLGPEVLVC